MPIVKLPYRPRGGARELFLCRDPEILMEGPAGTGKTRGVLEYVYYLCTTFPGCRGLFLRLTRASLTESALVTWETKVLWEGHPAMTGNASMEHRRSYTFPLASNVVKGVTYTGRTHIALAGLDKPSRTFSQEYDFVVLFEAIEVLYMGVWELIQRCLRNWVIPFQQAIAETNPGPASFWANQRADVPLERDAGIAEVLGPVREGQMQMTRILSRHEDNPELWDAVNRRWHPKGASYIAKLDAMSGANKERMRWGRWVAESGLIWPIDKRRHMVLRTKHANSPIQDLPCHRRDKAGALVFDWYFGAQDWGMTDAGVLGIWGVDEARRAIYLVAEVYQTEKRLTWWGKTVKDLHQRFELRKLFCDRSRKDLIAYYNDVLLGRDQVDGEADLESLAVGALNDFETGVQAVRDMLGPADDGMPRLFFCHDTLILGRDEDLAGKLKPICTVQEVESWVWRKDEAGKDVKERPAPGQADHGCDMTKYAVLGFLGAGNLAEGDGEDLEEYDPESMGDVLRHKEKWEKIHNAEELDEEDEFGLLGDYL